MQSSPWLETCLKGEVAIWGGGQSEGFRVEGLGRFQCLGLYFLLVHFRHMRFIIILISIPGMVGSGLCAQG